MPVLPTCLVPRWAARLWCRADHGDNTQVATWDSFRIDTATSVPGWTSTCTKPSSVLLDNIGPALRSTLLQDLHRSISPDSLGAEQPYQSRNPVAGAGTLLAKPNAGNTPVGCPGGAKPYAHHRQVTWLFGCYTGSHTPSAQGELRPSDGCHRGRAFVAEPMSAQR